MANIYYVNGNVIPISGGQSVTYSPYSTEFDRVVNGVAHRGYSDVAPQNTLPAYQKAKDAGFFYVETDIRFTSDGIPVCIHDATIDSTSDGTGDVARMTFDELRQYDFGSWKSAEYTGTKIPSFDEFIALCRDIILSPYIELKVSMTLAQVQGLFATVRDVGMDGKITWISGYSSNLAHVVNYDPYARVGLVLSNFDLQSSLTELNNLKTGTNEVFADVNMSYVTSEVIGALKTANIPLEVWTVDNTNTILSADKYITGFTSNKYIAEKVLYDANIN